MADPIVHITNGTPDAGTGNITTLGQTLLDGADLTQGANADLAVAAGAAGSISAKLRSISRDIIGGIVLQPGVNTIGAVTQSGGPWSVSGTVAATQSGAWNVGNVTGTISLPTGAATSGLQPSNAGIGSATAGQTGTISMGATTTGAPSYTTGQTNPLSLTTNGALRTDSSATTQPVSGTIAVSGTVAVTESGTWTVQPGNTANTTPWLMTISQGGNPATVSATGALKTDASATTQPVSATALPLPAGASTAALQPTNAAQGSTTTGQTGPLVQGAVATAAPTYTNGTTSPVSLTTAGAIRVDGSAATQPVSGTVTANQGGTWNQRLQDGAGNAITSDARGTERPLSVQILDATGNQITSFGAGSGPSFGSAFPANGSAIGMKDSAGVNMVAFNANASGALKVDNSAVTQPVSGTFWQATQPVSGTFWQATQPVSAAALPLPSGASTSANQPTNVTQASSTTSQTGSLGFGAVTSGSPSYLTAQSYPLSLTTAGALRVDGSAVTQPISGTVAVSGSMAVTQSGTWNITNISGTISLPTGAATSANQPTNAALGSTTSGQTGQIGLGAVTTGAPAYTTATTNALSLNTAGGLRVDGSGVTQPVSGTVTASQGGTWTVQPGNTANTTPWLVSASQSGTWNVGVTGSVTVNGTITANQGGNWTSRTVGNAGGIVDAAQNAAAPANEIVVGGTYNSAAPTLTSGNASQLQLDASGNLNVNIKAGAGSGGTASTFGAAIPSTGTAAGYSDGTNMQLARVFDGDSGAGTQYSLGVLLKTPASGGATDIGIAAAPLRIDPTGTTTQPISGTITANQGGAWTVAATQSGAWNVTNITGTISLPTGAATSANQPTAAAQGSATSGQTGNLGLAAVTTSSPGYTTGQSSPLSLTVSGALRVDGSAVTQGVSGTVNPLTIGSWGLAAGTQNVGTPTNGQLVQGQYNSAPTTITSGNISPLQLDASGNLRVNIMAGGGAGGGTSSTIGAAMPTVATVAMGSVTTAAPTYTTATANSLSINTSGGLRVDGSGVTQPVSGTFWQATQPVSGTFWQTTQPVSAASLPLPAGASSSANQPTNAAIASTTSGQTGAIAMGAVTTAAPAYTTAQTNPLSLTTVGALRVDGSAVTQPVSGNVGITGTATISGTVTANQGGAWTVAATQSGAWNITNITGTVSLPTGAATSANQPSNAAAASTTSGQTGNLAMGAVTTGAPAYTTGQTNNLSLTTVGNLRVDGSSVTQPVSGTFWQATQPVSGTFFQATQPVSIAAAVTVAQATAANLNATVTGTVAATQSGTWTVQQGTPPWLTGGDVANAATDTGNPIKIGGQAQTGNPTAVTSGQRVNAMFDKVGKLITAGAIRTLKGMQQTSIVGASETTIVTAGAAGVFRDLYGLILANTSATSVYVIINDATGGLQRMVISLPANDTRGFTVPVDSALPQTTAASNWTATVNTAVTAIQVTALYVQNT